MLIPLFYHLWLYIKQTGCGRRKGTKIHLNSVSRLVSQALWNTGTMTVTTFRTPWRFEKLTYSNKRCYRFPIQMANNKPNNKQYNHKHGTFSYHIHNRKCIIVGWLWLCAIVIICFYLFSFVFLRFLSRWLLFYIIFEKHFPVDIFTQLAIFVRSLVSGGYDTLHVDWQRSLGYTATLAPMVHLCTDIWGNSEPLLSGANRFLLTL